jgi:pimeloyl-ACP methyl ester carboxylesterase
MMSTYVLIHGGYHGSWCWEKVIPLLERKGHVVLAPDLPGHGHDQTPAKAISLQTYVDCVGKILAAQPKPVILVGHSLGGLVITQTAEEHPHQIRLLVYLTALLPRTGESLIQLVQKDTGSALRESTVIFEEQGSYITREEDRVRFFYTYCAEEDINRAKALLVPEPLAPVMTPVATTAERFGRVPRAYIECLRDQALSPFFQKKMYTDLPCQRVLSLNTDHSPFFSAPEALAAHLHALSGEAEGIEQGAGKAV